MNPHSQETAYLRRLIEDFPAKTKPKEAPEALRIIAIRYQTLEGEQAFRSISGDAINQMTEIENLAYLFKRRAFLMHQFLFKDILSNAGQSRKASDPHGGRIEFGGRKHQQHRSKFIGVKCKKIDVALDNAFAHLILEPMNPIEQAMRFYQQFVYIHPFYDANGRIGRVSVSNYLNLFNFHVKWGAFDGPNNAKFVKKLNECHKRMDSGFHFEQHFNYLLRFFRKNIVSFEELSDFK